MAEQEVRRKGIVIKKAIEEKSLSMPQGFTNPEDLYKKLIEMNEGKSLIEEKYFSAFTAIAGLLVSIFIIFA